MDLAQERQMMVVDGPTPHLQDSDVLGNKFCVSRDEDGFGNSFNDMEATP